MADPMTVEQLTEIRERAAHIAGYGGARAGDVLARVDVPALLAEVDRLRGALKDAAEQVAEGDDRTGQEAARAQAAEAEVERLRAELAQVRTTDTDVTWLADRIQATIRDVSVRTATGPEHAQDVIAQEVEAYISAGGLTMFISSRVVDLAVDYIREQRNGIESRVHAAFAGADERGQSLDAMTVAELTDLVTTAVDAGMAYGVVVDYAAARQVVYGHRREDGETRG